MYLLNNLLISLFTVVLIFAGISSTFKKNTTSKKTKRISWIAVAVLFVLVGATIPPTDNSTNPEDPIEVVETVKPMTAKSACSSVLASLALVDITENKGLDTLPEKLKKYDKLEDKNLKTIISNIQEMARITDKDIKDGDATKIMADAIVISGYIEELHTYCKEVLK